MSLREAISNPDSDFRKQMNEDWMDYVSSKVEDSPEAGEADAILRTACRETGHDQQ